MKRSGRVAVVVAAAGLVVAMADPAGACGGLIAANGAVQLVRTSTLAAWDNGFEHYITSFEFASDQESFGSIIPLPSEPITVERAGDWTLQRLQREISPPNTIDQAASASLGEDSAQVLRQVRIDSLDVTILKGGGTEVAEWAETNGFDIDPSTPEMLEFYSSRSPFFMAARFDAAAAQERGFTTGDGVPVHLVMPLESPWVPLHILSLGKPDEEVVAADVFLLTPTEPSLYGLDNGVKVTRSAPASRQLLDDLRSDRNMGWVPQDAHFTHIAISAPAGELNRDLATDLAGRVPNPGTGERPRPASALIPNDRTLTVIALVLGGVLVTMAASVGVVWTTRRRHGVPETPGA
ncbi:MAG: DUF2330 domain-containing protein [Acidimicrobiales bacterium]